MGMALWDNVGDSKFTGKTMLMDKSQGYRMNPVHYGLEMLWRSIGMEMLHMDTSAYRLHGFCARPVNSTSEASTQTCYVLNKYEDERTIKMKNRYAEGSKVVVEVLVDTDDHWGKVLNETIVWKDEYFSYPVPALSFVAMTFNGK